MKKAIVGITILLGVGIGYLVNKQVEKNKENIEAFDEELRKIGKLE